MNNNKISPINEEINAQEGIRLRVEKRIVDDRVEISLSTKNNKDCLLHWGVSPRVQASWQIPPRSVWPQGTKSFGQDAVQTPFLTQNGEKRVSIRLQPPFDFSAIHFALYFPEGKIWDNNKGKNYQIQLPDASNPLPSPVQILQDEMAQPSAKHLNLAEEIIHSETESDSWTLMHRFNLCYDLLDSIGDHPKEWVEIFVWLRFSAIRQLVWQKNYNTQPRELSYAMDRLTLKLAGIYIKSEPSIREMIRLIFTTLGRGGEGQRIRDEFLNIMHRHKIKELAGTFMEEWHQKIHNNTTPDDIVICEAYLKFLKKDGDLKSFYKSLDEGGVPRKRLKSFERPILSAPEFYPDIQDALIQDLEDYLKILRSVHSGVDLESAIQAAHAHLDKKTHLILQSLQPHGDDPEPSVSDLISKITDARYTIASILTRHADLEKARDLLFLDLALEEFLRIALERHIHARLDKDELAALMAGSLQNTMLSHHNVPEFEVCFQHWARIMEMPGFHQDWALHAKSVLDRLGRTIGKLIDHYYSLIQPSAESLGKALHVDLWTIPLFSEEVVRGRLIFILSLLLRYMDPILRKAAHLGNWQVISPGQGIGCVKWVDHLRFIQGKTFLRPTVVIADKINGDEEIPDGVTALITPDVTDIVSHIAVRARNKNLLFATCYDLKIINHLKSLKGEPIQLATTSSHEVVIKRGIESRAKIQILKFNIPRAKKTRRDFHSQAIVLNDFNDRWVGQKAYNLKRLQGKLPEWVHIPPSAALPFGVFEKLLNHAPNKRIKTRYQSTISKINEHPQEMLSALRSLIMEIEPSDELLSSLRESMQNAGLIWPENCEKTWRCIKRVWASKWNERAYFSRLSAGIPHHDLFMSVLIQNVVEAEYAFVIHTANPLNNSRNELYGELVPGLGETLVGNYHGRALSFVSKKDGPDPQVLAYPSKSTGLYGRGLIFRSDSSGEDLSGYAGAGLYDSIMFEAPEERLLDYTNEPILWNQGFRKEMLSCITKIGIEVEKIFDGCPQDIEGVYSRGVYFVVQTRPQVGLQECQR